MTLLEMILLTKAQKKALNQGLLSFELIIYSSFLLIALRFFLISLRSSLIVSGSSSSF